MDRQADKVSRRGDLGEKLWLERVWRAEQSGRWVIRKHWRQSQRRLMGPYDVVFPTAEGTGQRGYEAVA